MTKAITDVLAVIGDANAGPPESSFVRIPVDLNMGCGGRYIYLCFKRADGPPITDFRVKFGKNVSPDRGYTHVRAYDPATLRYGEKLDLNATVGGEYIYLTFTRSPGTPVVDLIVQAWKHPAPEPDPPSDEHGNKYDRIAGELNKGAEGWYIMAAQLRRQPDADPPDFRTDTAGMLRAYLNHAEWEIARAQVGIDRVAVRRMMVEAKVAGGDAEAGIKRVFTRTSGMEQSVAETIARQWGIKTTGGFTYRGFTTGVETVLGRTNTTSTTFTTSKIDTQSEEVELVPDPSDPGGYRMLYSLELVDVLLTYPLGSGVPMYSAISYPAVFAAAYQKTRKPDPNAQIYAIPIQQHEKPLVFGGGTFEISAEHSGKVCDIEGASKAEGARLIQWDPHGGANQRYEFHDVGDGTYGIEAVHSGRYLDVAGADVSSGAQIIQWDWHGGPNQRWRLVAQADGTYGIQAVHSGRYLDVAGADVSSGAQIIQWDWHGGPNQRWRLTPA